MIVPITSADPADPGRTLRSPLLACLFAVAVQVLDMTMLATALPAVTRVLGLSATHQVLVVSGYSLIFGCALLTGAQFGDRFGRRPAYLTGMTGFAVCAGWCATASSGTELVAARCAQGLFGALVAAQTLAIITTSFGPRRRATAFAAHSATAAAVAVAGPVLGGLLVAMNSAGTGWRSVFLAEMVLALVAVAVARRFLPGDRPATDARFDVTGAVLGVVVVAALLSPVLPLGGTRSIAGLAFGGACVAAAVPLLVHRARVSRRTGWSPLRLFARRDFALGAVAVIGFSAIFAGLPLTVSNTVQLGLGFSAPSAGILLLPSAAGAVAGALTAPMLARRNVRGTLTAGMLLFGFATVSVALLIDPASGRIDVPVLVLPLAVAGMGLGWFAAPLPALLMSRVDSDGIGPASGAVPTLQQFGGALGPALLLTGLEREPPPAARAFDAAAASEYLGALTGALWIVAGAAAVLVGVVLALPKGQ